MIASRLDAILMNAVPILKSRGYKVVWSISLRERYSPETFVCIRSADDILHVKLKLSPNILTSGEEIARFCSDEIRVLRRLMRTNPEKSGEHYEVWVSMPWGKFTALEVLPDMLIDQRSGVVLSPRPTGGVPA
jgi:hypothetical protein